jgi:glycopeptide antibiotics resistance protein
MHQSAPGHLRGWRWVPVAAYAAVIALLALTSRRGTSGALTPNYVPFDSIRDLLSGSSSRVAIVNNLLGNMLLFAPLAVLMRLLVLRTSTWTLVTVLAGSVLVELVQGLGVPDGRQANVDDVLLNVAGAALALLLLRLVRAPATGR